MLDHELLQQLRAIRERTGLSVAQQIRQGIRWWLQSRQWPSRLRADADKERAPHGEP
jgi:hypothetical protein